MKIFDDVFDKKFLDDLSYRLMNSAWFANNTANSKTWPYGNKGTHLLLGELYYLRVNDDVIKMSKTAEDLSHSLKDSFYHLQKISNTKLKLIEIFANLQFKDMNGTNHIDGKNDETVFILMLSNEIIDEDIGGEFIHEDTKKIVKYKYGRVIQFNANEIHRAMAFNKPNIARLSIKWVGKKFDVEG